MNFLQFLGVPHTELVRVTGVGIVCRELADRLTVETIRQGIVTTNFIPAVKFSTLNLW